MCMFDHFFLFLQDDFEMSQNAGAMLDNFCAWQRNWNPTHDSNPQHSDYVTLLTKYVCRYNEATLIRQYPSLNAMKTTQYDNAYLEISLHSI